MVDFVQNIIKKEAVSKVLSGLCDNLWGPLW